MRKRKSEMTPEERRKARAWENNYRKRRRQRERLGQTPYIRAYAACEPRPPDGDVAARLAEIPPDDRTDAQRLLGDPGRHRSALAQRSAP